MAIFALSWGMYTGTTWEKMVMTTFVYERGTALDIRLRLLDLAIGADTHERVLDAIGVGIRQANERADSDEDGIVDDEIEFVENLLGAAYVVCQVQGGTGCVESA